MNVIQVVAFDLGNTIIHEDFNATRSLRTLPGVLAALEELQNAGLRLCIASNSAYPIEHTKHILERVKLTARFNDVFTSHSLEASKPEPLFYERMLEQLGVEPVQCIMVGDSYANDIAGAKAAGLHTIWLTDEADGADKADVVVHSMRAVPDAVYRIDAQRALPGGDIAYP